MAIVPAKELRTFFTADLDAYGSHRVVTALRYSGLKDRFYELPKLTALVATYLRGHAELQVKPLAGMYKLAEQIVGRAVAR